MKMTNKIITGSLAGCTLLLVAVVNAGWRDYAMGLEGILGNNGNTSIASQPTQDEMTSGLKEALAQGVTRAIQALGKENGYLGNQLVRIPMPSAIQPVAKAARSFGGGRYVDEFETTMNRAAEQAVPEAAEIFGNAVSQMSIEDARQILTGPDDSATNYFRKTAGDELVKRFRPVVTQATDRAGVTSAYKNMAGQAGPFIGALGSDITDVDGYITQKAVDGLFLMIAQEEKRIRENPLARGTDLMKKVFGATY